MGNQRDEGFQRNNVALFLFAAAIWLCAFFKGNGGNSLAAVL